MEFLIAQKIGVTFGTAYRIAQLILYGFDVATVALLVWGIAGVAFRLILMYVKRQIANMTLRQAAML
ncbi:MAG: hypothetical protein C4570_00815 [Ammonifex sp.]|jgi:hypothetical protein|nr:MAG: hypothetical protein C4570_00815 [Ammonifex sp.]